MSQMAAFVGAAVGATLRTARTAAICGRSLSVSAPAAARATAPVRVRVVSLSLGLFALLLLLALCSFFEHALRREAGCAMCCEGYSPTCCSTALSRLPAALVWTASTEAYADVVELLTILFHPLCCVARLLVPLTDDGGDERG